jgi:hypothetical protein
MYSLERKNNVGSTDSSSDVEDEDNEQDCSTSTDTSFKEK